MRRVLVLILLAASPVAAQTESPPANPHGNADLDCTACHAEAVGPGDEVGPRVRSRHHGVPARGCTPPSSVPRLPRRSGLREGGYRLRRLSRRRPPRPTRTLLRRLPHIRRVARSLGDAPSPRCHCATPGRSPCGGRLRCLPQRAGRKLVRGHADRLLRLPRGDLGRDDHPPHEASGFGTDCVQCHGVYATGWSSSDFRHPASFPLSGGHAFVDCSACHADGFANTPTDCAAVIRTTTTLPAIPITRGPASQPTALPATRPRLGSPRTGTTSGGSQSTADATGTSGTRVPIATSCRRIIRSSSASPAMRTIEPRPTPSTERFPATGI